MMTWLLSHWPAVVAAVAVLVGGAKLWLSRWRVQRALEATRGERDRAEIERDAARGDAAVAEMRATVTADHVGEIEAAERAAERIEDVPITDDSVADRRALYDALRVRRTRDDGRDP